MHGLYISIRAAEVQKKNSNSRVIPRESGWERDKQKAEGEEREERNQWLLFLLLIASCFLLRTAGKVSVRAWTEISLSLFLSCYLSVLFISSLSGLFFLFLPSLDVLHLQGGEGSAGDRVPVINRTVWWQQTQTEQGLKIQKTWHLHISERNCLFSTVIKKLWVDRNQIISPGNNVTQRASPHI